MALAALVAVEGLGACTPAPGGGALAPGAATVPPASAPDQQIPPPVAASTTEPATANDAGSGPPTTTSLEAEGSPTPAPPPGTVAVAVQNIGMHIGGGPNDAATKAPFITALDAKRADFERCYAQVDTKGARGTFGVDLMIAAAGGHPETSNVRTVLPGTAFRTCMLAAFAAVEFAPTRHGRTKLSYALRFEPAERSAKPRSHVE